MRIYLTATIKGKPEHVEELKALLEQLAVNAKTEKACVQYDLHQGIDDPLLFVFMKYGKAAKGWHYIMSNLILNTLQQKRRG
ncbi:putative quinol monooxygenase [Chitinophagaceae bacterium LWZ2-11]